MAKSTIARIVANSVALANESGKIVRRVFKNGELGIVNKEGIKNYQTEADRAVERLIVSSIKAQYPNICVIGEEDQECLSNCGEIVRDECEMVLSQPFPTDATEITEDDICIWVDPLDGTAEFVDGLLNHVTVLIGIAVNGKAKAGIIHQPFFGYETKDPKEWGRTIWGYVGMGAFGPFEQKKLPSDKIIITTTRSHSTQTVTDCLAAMQPNEILRVGGAGNKVLRVIEGDAHCYLFPASGTKKWDTCAPEAVLTAMGGCLTDVHGNRLAYDPSVEQRNDRGVIATINPERHQWFLSKVPSTVKNQFP